MSGRVQSEEAVMARRSAGGLEVQGNLICSETSVVCADLTVLHPSGLFTSHSSSPYKMCKKWLFGELISFIVKLSMSVLCSKNMHLKLRDRLCILLTQ